MEEIFAAVDAFNGELQASGVWVFAGGLMPAAFGDRGPVATVSTSR